jgi:hypothetical protein
MEHRAQAAIQVYRDRRVFNRVGHRPQFLSVGKSRTRDQEQRNPEDEREYRRVDSFEGKGGRFAGITNGPSGF